MDIALVWAQASDGAIGRDGGMPWHLPEDLAQFKSVTMGAPVVMGRRTWESLPERFRPLPGRENIVISRDGRYGAEGARVHPSLESALGELRESGEARVSVIGGGQLYRSAMPSATELVVTRIDAEIPDADTFAPVIGDEWKLESATEAAVSSSGLAYRFERYRRA